VNVTLMAFPMEEEDVTILGLWLQNSKCIELFSFSFLSSLTCVCVFACDCFPLSVKW
jgi:hypothetical protein